MHAWAACVWVAGAVVDAPPYTPIRPQYFSVALCLVFGRWSRWGLVRGSLQRSMPHVCGPLSALTPLLLLYPFPPVCVSSTCSSAPLAHSWAPRLARTLADAVACLCGAGPTACSVAPDLDVLAVVLEVARFVRNACAGSPAAQTSLGLHGVASPLCRLLASTHMLAPGGEAWSKRATLTRAVVLSALHNLCVGHPGNRRAVWAAAWPTLFQVNLQHGAANGDRTVLDRSLGLLHACAVGDPARMAALAAAPVVLTAALNAVVLTGGCESGGGSSGGSGSGSGGAVGGAVGGGSGAGGGGGGGSGGGSWDDPPHDPVFVWVSLLVEALVSESLLAPAFACVGPPSEAGTTGSGAVVHVTHAQVVLAHLLAHCVGVGMGGEGDGDRTVDTPGAPLRLSPGLLVAVVRMYCVASGAAHGDGGSAGVGHGSELGCGAGSGASTGGSSAAAPVEAPPSSLAEETAASQQAQMLRRLQLEVKLVLCEILSESLSALHLEAGDGGVGASTSGAGTRGLDGGADDGPFGGSGSDVIADAVAAVAGTLLPLVVHDLQLCERLPNTVVPDRLKACLLRVVANACAPPCRVEVQRALLASRGVYTVLSMCKVGWRRMGAGRECVVEGSWVGRGPRQLRHCGSRSCALQFVPVYMDAGGVHRDARLCVLSSARGRWTPSTPCSVSGHYLLCATCAKATRRCRRKSPTSRQWGLWPRLSWLP
jgi:hypothetical protein